MRSCGYGGFPGASRGLHNHVYTFDLSLHCSELEVLRLGIPLEAFFNASSWRGLVAVLRSGEVVCLLVEPVASREPSKLCYLEMASWMLRWEQDERSVETCQK